MIDYDVIPCSYAIPVKCPECGRDEKEFVILDFDDLTQQKMCVSCFDNLID